MSVSDAAQLRRSRTQLVLIILLFMLPPAAAWVAWQYLGEKGVDATTNAGTLIVPARPLQVTGLVGSDGQPITDDGLRGRWTFVLFAPSGCADACREQLYLTRQVRIAMNKDVGRVARLLVLAQRPSATFAQQLADEHPDLAWVIRDDRAGALLERFRGAGFAPDGAHYFLVDPLGNLMMHYDLSVPTKGMMKDLQKLLKVSQIG